MDIVTSLPKSDAYMLMVQLASFLHQVPKMVPETSPVSVCRVNRASGQRVSAAR